MLIFTKESNPGSSLATSSGETRLTRTRGKKETIRRFAARSTSSTASTSCGIPRSSAATRPAGRPGRRHPVVLRPSQFVIVQRPHSPVLVFHLLHLAQPVVRLLDRPVAGDEDGGDVAPRRVEVLAQLDAETDPAMKQVLSDIQSGEFARQWIEENKSGKGLQCRRTNLVRGFSKVDWNRNS